MPSAQGCTRTDNARKTFKLLFKDNKFHYAVKRQRVISAIKKTDINRVWLDTLTGLTKLLKEFIKMVFEEQPLANAVGMLIPQALFSAPCFCMGQDRLWDSEEQHRSLTAQLICSSLLYIKV